MTMESFSNGFQELCCGRRPPLTYEPPPLSLPKPAQMPALEIAESSKTGPAICAEHHKCLDVEAVRNDFRRYRVIKQGYTGLCWFVLLILAHVFCIGKQRDAWHVGDVNSALQIFLDKNKADLKTTDEVSLYKFMSTTLLPELFKHSWSKKSAIGARISGHTTNDFYQLVGGVVLTATKSKVSRCFHGNSCYLTDHAHEPFYHMTLPGGNVTFPVPFNSHFQGYSLNIPSSVDPAHSKTLLSAYSDFFGPDNRELRLHAVLLNPHGVQTLTLLQLSSTITTNNKIDFQTASETMPYHWYQRSSQTCQSSAEVLVACAYIHCLIQPFLNYVAKRANNFRNDPIEIHSWIQSWESLPQVGGRPLFVTPLILVGLLLVALCLWLYLGSLHSAMVNLFKAEWLFEELSTEGALPDVLTKVLVSMDERVLPLVKHVERITSVSECYFFVQVLVFICILWRLQELLLFQKRLSLVWMTFDGISDDLIHISITLCLFCFGIGAISYLVFGEVDETFRDPVSAFIAKIEATLVGYKSASEMFFVQSLGKYSPHVLRTEANITWLPLAVFLVFKMFVPLFMFRVLNGIIMDGFAKHRPREDIPTLRDDFRLLFIHFRKLLLPGHVPFIQVALAIAHHERLLEQDKDAAPWKSKYLGLGSSMEVLQALNDVTGRYEDPAKEFKLIQCEQLHLDYVLKTYGIRRNLALHRTAKECHKGEVKAGMQVAYYEDTLDTQAILDSHMGKWHRRSGYGRLMNTEARNKFDEDVKNIFYLYDFQKLGTVDIRCVFPMLQLLGFKVGAVKAAKVIARHDHNGDQHFSLEEFRVLLLDTDFIGRFKAPTSSYHPSTTSLLNASSTTPLLNR